MKGTHFLLTRYQCQLYLGDNHQCIASLAFLHNCTCGDHTCNSSCIHPLRDVNMNTWYYLLYFIILFFLKTTRDPSEHCNWSLSVGFLQYSELNCCKMARIIQHAAYICSLQDCLNATKLSLLAPNSWRRFLINCSDQHADEQTSDSCVSCRYYCDESWLLSSSNSMATLKLEQHIKTI